MMSLVTQAWDTGRTAPTTVIAPSPTVLRGSASQSKEKARGAFLSAERNSVTRARQFSGFLGSIPLL